MERSPVRYARTADDVDIAYWTVGSGGPLLVEGPLIPFTHVEAEWRNPHVRLWYERMAEMVTLVRYDARGTGMSQRDVDDVSLEGHVMDLEAVARQFDGDPIALLGVFHSGPPAVLYAALHPERVSHLLLWCTYARGADYWTANQSEGLRALRQTDYELFLRTAAHELIGWADDGESDAFAQVMLEAVDPARADQLLASTRSWDVSEALSRVVAPTLVLHRRDLRWIPVELSRTLAASVAGAELLDIGGSSPLPAAGPVDEAVAAVSRFLGVGSMKRPNRAMGAVQVVLFTDLVDHSRMMDALGDERGRAVLREHEQITRAVIDAFGGREVKSLGDGFMASFDGVSAALGAATALQRSMEERNATKGPDDPVMHVRAGINAGEPVEEDGDLFGAAVILASRIAGQASGGEVLVSNAVRELAAGKAFSFGDPRMMIPKGFAEEVRVWSLGWR